MDRNERQLIQDLFVRLRGAEGQVRDPEAERLIADELRRAPSAPYTMAQIILAQNQALENAARKIEDLEASASAGEAPEGGSPWGAPGMGAAPGAAPGPRGSVPAFGGRPGFGQGGGFLANAGQMALGVAGGMLIGEAAKSLLGGGSEAQAATPDAASAAGSPLADQAGADDVSGTDNAAGEGEGGGGIFGWLFGGGDQEQGAADEPGMADSGWDDDGGGWDSSE